MYIFFVNLNTIIDSKAMEQYYLRQLREIRRKINAIKKDHLYLPLIIERARKSKMTEEKIWESISMNYAIPWEFIMDNLDKPLLWNRVSENYGVTFEIVKANPGFRWNYYGITRHRNITMEIIENNPGFPWVRNAIIENPNITLEYVKKNRHIHVISRKILTHKIISLDIISTIENRYAMAFYISSNPNLTMEFVNKYPDFPWNYNMIARYGKLTIQDIRDNYDKFSSCMANLVINENISTEDIKNNDDLPWPRNTLLSYKADEEMIDIDNDDLRYIANNENISAEFIWENRSKMFKVWSDRNNFSSNPNLSYKFVLLRPKFLWYYDKVLSTQYTQPLKLKKLQQEYDEIMKKLCIEFCYNIIHKMHAAPNGYYFKKGLEEHKRLTELL